MCFYSHFEVRLILCMMYLSVQSFGLSVLLSRAGRRFRGFGVTGLGLLGCPISMMMSIFSAFSCMLELSLSGCLSICQMFVLEIPNCHNTCCICLCLSYWAQCPDSTIISQLSSISLNRLPD